MALNFPNSPTDGQIYSDTQTGNRWVWDNANTCWKSTSTYAQTITVSSTQPGSPVIGQLWWNKDYGRLLVYYSDADSSQWVDASPNDFNAVAAFRHANAGFTRANTALQNTSGTFAGDLSISGTANVASNMRVGANLSFDNIDSVRIWEPTANTLTVHTASTERMRIDSAGRVTKPSQPFFMGYPTTDYSAGSMPTRTMDVTAAYNNGNHFNATTDIFTCPITGWYRITWGGLQLPSTVTSLKVNGSRAYSGNHCIGGSYYTLTQTVLRQLNANDTLEIEQWNGGGYHSAWWLWSVELVG